MLTPSANAALSPALSIMQSIIAGQAQMHRPDQPAAIGQTPNVAVTPGYSTQTTQKINAYYFGDHQSVSEVQAKIFTYLAQYVGKQIEAVENGKTGNPAGDAPGASAELTKDLKDMDDDVRGSLGAALTEFAEGRKSIQATAFKLLMTLDLDSLSKDTKFTKYLEQMIGFELHGMNVKDILMSFVDPDGKESDKLRSIVSNALAGEAGSKVLQRLDDASKGLRSVEETRRDIEDVKPYDEIDEETDEENRQDIKTAKAYETLNETLESIDVATEESVALAEAKAAIEAAKDTSKPTETSPAPSPEDDKESDASGADDENDAAVAGMRGYWEQVEKANNHHSETTALYL